MKTQVSIIFIWFAILRNGVNSKYGGYTNCDSSKHCIECLQMEMHWGRRYNSVPNQENYKQLLLYTINEFRNKYAEMFSIGNMRYAEWNKILYDICHVLTSETGDTKYNCVTGAKTPNIPTRFDHDMVDFDSTVDITVHKNSTDIFDDQFKILLTKMFEVVHITDYNMDEFGCEYAYRPLKDSTDFLLRCMFYTNPEFGVEDEIYSVVPCSNCSASETCSYEQPWLCVKNKILNLIEK